MRINFELLDLRVFLGVVDCESFHGAAKLLNLSQPALSRRIQALEQRVGCALFERTTRHVSLTRSGRKLEPIARRMVQEIDGSIPHIRADDADHPGHVTISSIPSAAVHFVPQVAQKFNQKYPLFRLTVVDRPPSEALDCVIHGEVDFGINLVGASETDVAFTPLMEEPYLFVCREEHPLARTNRITWRQLQRHELVRVGRARSGNRAVLDNALSRAGVHLNWRFEVNNLTTAVGLVQAGLGATVLPRLATLHIDSPALVARPIERPAVTRTVGIVERRTSRLSQAAMHFRQLLMWYAKDGTF
jgi:DNA-binding transcriptional LysR family regulator